MAFEELQQQSEAIKDSAKDYVKSTVSYYRLLGFKFAMKSTTMILKFALIGFALSFVLLFASIAGAFALGEYFQSYPLGFLAVAGIYVVLTLLLFLIKDKFFEGPILEKFSEIFFND